MKAFVVEIKGSPDAHQIPSSPRSAGLDDIARMLE
jgi:hypothetical protein